NSSHTSVSDLSQGPSESCVDDGDEWTAIFSSKPSEPSPVVAAMDFPTPAPISSEDDEAKHWLKDIFTSSSTSSNSVSIELQHSVAPSSTLCEISEDNLLTSPCGVRRTYSEAEASDQPSASSATATP